MLVEPLRGTDKWTYHEITFRQGGAAIEAMAGYLATADVVIVRRPVGDPLMIPSTQVWLRISALLKANEQGLACGG